ncbi:MAG: glycosyltransferase family 4 protein [Caulobacteraceae bacterium]|jgi:phosphatidylinositol alpha-1,6-mannosyltransferase
MRVLALVSEAFGGYGGIAQYNRDLFTAMSAFAAKPVVDVLPRYARERAGPLPDRVRQYAAVGDRQLLALTALALAERRRPDVVFSGHLHLSPLAAWIARRHHAPLVQQAHGVEVWSRPGEVRRRSVEAAELVLCVSRDTRARVLSWADLPPERVRVAPNTVSDRFAPGSRSEARAHLGLAGQKVILSVSRLDAGQRHKGQERIIGLLPALVARGLDVLYLIAGEGDDAARLAALATATGVSERVRLLGRVPAGELADLYRAADLFALPSTGDGFGIVFLEAMACGTPALGLAVGGAADAFADGALGMLASEANLGEAMVQALAEGRPAAAVADAVHARFGFGAFRARLERAFAGVFETAALA